MTEVAIRSFSFAARFATFLELILFFFSVLFFVTPPFYRRLSWLSMLSLRNLRSEQSARVISTD